MRKKLSVITALVLLLAAGLFLFAGCGSNQGQNLEDYMKDQTALRGSVDAQLGILSPDAKASVKYRADNKAEITVQYYAMADEEIAAIEPDKAKVRCNSIMKPVVEQFKADTGNTAEIVVNVEGRDPNEH